MLLYSYNFSVTFQRKYYSYCMKSLKKNKVVSEPLDAPLDALLFL